MRYKFARGNGADLIGHLARAVLIKIGDDNVSSLSSQ